ncbi:MAG: ATP synthase F0 subunit B [Armatimonadetes bacterium]|nr:ATP synthase F0 subunit B [Armatimonadota bacterium]
MLEALLQSLAIDPRVLLLNAAVFLLLLFVMSRVFWQPMLKHLDTRKARIQQAYRSVDDTRQEMERLRGEYQARLEEIEAEARGRIQQTVRVAQAARETMLAEARETAERLSHEGLERIQREHDTVRAEMVDTLNRVASDALGRAQGAPADESQRSLVREYLVAGRSLGARGPDQDGRRN